MFFYSFHTDLTTLVFIVYRSQKPREESFSGKIVADEAAEEHANTDPAEGMDFFEELYRAVDEDDRADKRKQIVDKTIDDDGPAECSDPDDLVMDVSDEDPPYSVNRDLPDKGLYSFFFKLFYFSITFFSFIYCFIHSYIFF